MDMAVVTDVEVFLWYRLSLQLDVPQKALSCG